MLNWLLILFGFLFAYTLAEISSLPHAQCVQSCNAVAFNHHGVETIASAGTGPEAVAAVAAASVNDPKKHLLGQNGHGQYHHGFGHHHHDHDHHHKHGGQFSNHHVPFCIRGCRFFSLLFLTSAKQLKSEDVSNMCLKTCRGAHPDPKQNSACEVGCKRQAKCFAKHQERMKEMEKNMMPGFLLHGAPSLGSNFWAPMQKLHEHIRGYVHNGIIRHFQIVVHAVKKPDDAKPHVEVEIHEQDYPIGKIVIGKPMDMDKHHGHHDKHHGHHHGHHRHNGDHMFLEERDHHPQGPLQRMNAWFHHMPEHTKIGLRWGLCALLILSIIGLLWLCCSTLATSPRQRVLSITKVFEKKPPQIQSGDIFYVDVNDKKPLLMDDELEIKVPQEKV